MNRRRFLRTGSVAATAALVGFRAKAQPAPAAEILATRVISHEPQYYHGWPTLTRRRNGDLWLVCSGGRQQHICPFGRVELMVSHDNGDSWGWPELLLDTPIDDRDTGVIETAKGSMLVTTFTSLAYERIIQRVRKKQSGHGDVFSAARLEEWIAADDRLSPEQRHAELGVWMIRSTDGGLSWSARYPTIVNSPHGPIQLADGRLLYAGKQLWASPESNGVCESRDDGQTWTWLAPIPPRPGDDPREYQELHAVEADGRIIVHIRNENKANYAEILQSESGDAGRSWTVPRPIGVWCMAPSFLLRLSNGDLLMSYGYRRKPFGIQARLSKDGARTWSAPIVITSDGVGTDLGYPSTVQFADGSLLTAWYELMKGNDHAVLRQTRWRIKSHQKIPHE